MTGRFGNVCALACFAASTIHSAAQPTAKTNSEVFDIVMRSSSPKADNRVPSKFPNVSPDADVNVGSDKRPERYARCLHEQQKAKVPVIKLTSLS